MYLQTLARTSLFGAFVALSACGGSSTSSPVTLPTPPPTDVSMLSDSSIRTPIDVLVVSRNGNENGTFDTATGFVTIGTTTSIAAGGGIDADLDYIRVTDTGALAISQTIDPITLGSAVYKGDANVRVTDTIAGAVYDGSATATMTVEFGATDGTTIAYTDFEGTRRIGLNAATSFTDGTVSVADVTATTGGALSGGTISVAGFGNVDFDGATTLVNGGFGGPSANEIGGIVTATATDGSLTSTFVGSR